MPSASELRERWHETLRPFGPPDQVTEEVFVALVARYREPGRHYHTLVHIAAMWEILEHLRGQVMLQDVTAVRLAVWFHDAVYDPRTTDNEAQCARLVRVVLPGLNVPPATVARVEELILATQTHQAAPDDIDCQALLDCDLAILGSSPAAYDAYAQAVRREYEWVSEAAFRAGRRKVLTAFLERMSLYGTPLMRAEREQVARRNLQRERDALA